VSLKLEFPLEGPQDLRDASDEDLIRRFCGKPPDTEAGEELARRCVPKLRTCITRMVFAKSSACPRGNDRNAFAEDALARANQYFIRGLPGFGFSGSFDGWLAKVARAATLDERRTIVGRSQEGPPVVESVEAMQEVGRPMPLDHPLFRSKYAAHPAEVVRDREHREIVKALLTLHAQASNRDADSAWTIGLRVWREAPIKEIAQLRGSSDRDVSRLIADDYPKLYDLLVGELGVTALRHL
jgi:hypothetical protein